MTEQDEVLTVEQQRRVVLAKAARGVLANSTLVSSSGPPVDDVIKLASWMEGPDLKVALWTSQPTHLHSVGYGPVGDDEEGPKDGWGGREDVPPGEDIRYTEDCEDEPLYDVPPKHVDVLALVRESQQRSLGLVAPFPREQYPDAYPAEEHDGRGTE